MSFYIEEMSKKGNTSEISVKRKIVNDSAKSKKKAKVEIKSEGVTMSVKELTKVTGLSESMLIVAMELLDSSNPLTLIDIVCPNTEIRSLNTDEIDAHRDEFAQKKHSKDKNEKKVKPQTDDEIRKFIVEKSEKALQSGGVRIAGSNQYEKMDATHKDRTLVNEFLGYAQTSRGYFVYVYFVGPSSLITRATELRNPRNWLPVHKSHLSLFHRRYRDTKPFHTHTKFDQCNFQEQIIPSYDPRYMMHRWLGREGKVHKPLLRIHKSLFEKETDFLVKHYQEEMLPCPTISTLHYYDETKPDNLTIDLSMDVEEEGVPRFNVAQDRLQQQAAGYCYRDTDLCHLTIEEIPGLSRFPLAKEIDLSIEEFLHIAHRVDVKERNPMPPDFYQTDPFIMVKAALMSLNIEMQIKRLPAILGDEKLQILEADNMKPILDYLGGDKACTEEIKAALFRCLLAFMATDMMTREEPDHINEIFEKRQGPTSFVPLSS